MSAKRVVSLILFLLLFSNIIFSFNVVACKDIVACGDATDGDYNLFMKVRDPSRPGLQVLSIIPYGYEYEYHHPWTGNKIDFETKKKYIGVATEDDIIPNIVKAGMTLSESGIAFGDADTGSNWINPTRYAWDDFDWIRYSCEKAETEDEAVNFLTKETVDDLHVTGVAENLFVVGPNKGFVVEADAYRYNIKEIENDVAVLSNYPKELWKTQRHKMFPISFSFDLEKEKYVNRGRIIRLNSLYGVRVVNVGDDSVIVRQVPYFRINYGTILVMGKPITINLGERETVGDFSVKLLDIDGRRAKLSVCNKYKAWEEKMFEYIKPEIGSITVKNMMNWSRLHEDELDGLRPMCEDRFEYEAVAIYRLPKVHYDKLSGGWFSPNHACSSIYVPFHICNKDIFEPYEDGKAAEVSFDLLNKYGHSHLTSYFEKVEEVFINENEFVEKIAKELIEDGKDVSDLITISDMSMQEQAWITSQIYSYLSESQNKEIVDLIGDIWEYDYFTSLSRMKDAIISLEEDSKNSFIIKKIIDIVDSICKSRIEMIKSVGYNISEIEYEYQTGLNILNKGKIETGFDYLSNTFNASNIFADPETFNFSSVDNVKEQSEDFFLYFLVLILIMILIFIFIRKRQDHFL